MFVGHGGWLGWDEKAQAFATRVCGIIGPWKHAVRGLSTNIANYNPVGYPCPDSAFYEEGAAHYCNWAAKDSLCCLPTGPCSTELLATYNSGVTELMYIQTLSYHLREQCTGFDPYFVIDTSRSGNPSARAAGECSAWCNLREARLGPLPTVDTGLDSVDAFFWIKTPGESDGCSEYLPDGSGRCPRFDAACASNASIGSRADEGSMRAPEAGQWYPALMRSLAHTGTGSASPLLGSDDLFRSASPSPPLVIAMKQNYSAESVVLLSIALLLTGLVGGISLAGALHLKSIGPRRTRRPVGVTKVDDADHMACDPSAM